MRTNHFQGFLAIVYFPVQIQCDFSWAHPFDVSGLPGGNKIRDPVRRSSNTSRILKPVHVHYYAMIRSHGCFFNMNSSIANTGVKWGLQL